MLRPRVRAFATPWCGVGRGASLLTSKRLMGTTQSRSTVKAQMQEPNSHTENVPAEGKTSHSPKPLTVKQREFLDSAVSDTKLPIVIPFNSLC